MQNPCSSFNTSLKLFQRVLYIGSTFLLITLFGCINFSPHNQELQFELTNAVELQDVNAVKCCIRKGADVNDKKLEGYVKGYTLLMLATSIYSNDAIVNILLNHGADISSYNELGKTAFMYAAAYCKIHTVKKIYSRGANIHARDYAGNTALHYAARNNNVEIVKFLIKKGVDINVTSNSNTTPLMEATLMGCFQSVQVLIECGADPNIRDIYGKSALDIADGLDKLEKYLVVHGAKQYCVDTY